MRVVQLPTLSRAVQAADTLNLMLRRPSEEGDAERIADEAMTLASYLGNRHNEPTEADIDAAEMVSRYGTSWSIQLDSVGGYLVLARGGRETVSLVGTGDISDNVRRNWSKLCVERSRLVVPQPEPRRGWCARLLAGIFGALLVVLVGCEDTGAPGNPMSSNYGEDDCCDCCDDDDSAANEEPEASLSIDSTGECACWIVEGEISCWPEGGCSLAALVPAPDGDTWKEVAVGQWHACAIDEEGTTECWGRCLDGACNVPGGEYVRVVTGVNFTCAEDIEHEVLCWGDNQ